MNNSNSIFTQMSQVEGPFSFEWIFWAVLLGLFLGFVINMGPAFITLVQTSLHQDFKSAILFAFGVILNDAVVIALCIFISDKLRVWLKNSGLPFHDAVPWFCLGAGAILVLFGVFTYFQKAKKRETIHEHRAKEIMQKEPDDTPSPFFFIGKGFALNVLNPFVWIFWFSAVAIVVGGTGNTIVTIFFFTIVLGTSFALDVLKAWGAAKLKRFFDTNRTNWLNRIAGILLVLCGLYFIVYKGILNLI